MGDIRNAAEENNRRHRLEVLLAEWESGTLSAMELHELCTLQVNYAEHCVGKAKVMEWAERAEILASDLNSRLLSDIADEMREACKQGEV